VALRMQVVFVKEYREHVPMIGWVRYPVDGEYKMDRKKARGLIDQGYAIDPLNPPPPIFVECIEDPMVEELLAQKDSEVDNGAD